MDLFDKLGSILPFLIFALITILGNLGDKKKPKVKVKTKPFPKGQKLPDIKPPASKEQEMKAYTQEMEAKVVEAQAEVPHAMAEAFRKGNMGVMDYYNLKNIQADTEMRDSISKSTGDSQLTPPAIK